MSKKTEGLAAQLAQLARIELSDSALEQMQAQLGSILTYIETLQQLDLREVPERLDPPVDPSASGAGLREDRVADPWEPARLLEAAPQSRGELIVVPKVKGEAS